VLANLRRNAAEQDWQTPNRILDRLAEIDLQSNAVPILRSEILVAQGEQEQGEKLPTAALEKSPKDAGLRLALISLAERREDPERSERLLGDAKAALGDSVQMRLAEAGLLVNHKGAAAKEQLRELAAAKNSFSKDEQLALYSGLAGLTLG